jgi:hypothetical protein
MSPRVATSGGPFSGTTRTGRSCKSSALEAAGAIGARPQPLGFDEPKAERFAQIRDREGGLGVLAAGGDRFIAMGERAAGDGDLERMG